MRIVIVDSYYPQFLESWRFDLNAHYQKELRRLLTFSFGTGDFYSRNLRTLGWDVCDLIWNVPLQHDVFLQPDVVFMQDLSIAPPVRGRILAGQCSCPMPPQHLIEKYDVIFTSFPHYVARFEAMGIKAIYNPLAFDPIVIDRLEDIRSVERTLDVVFIGGVGNPSHWRRGMETLEMVAREIPTFKWWGYGIDTLPPHSSLIDKYQGPAWGLDMYRILRRAKVVLNRHGEVAEGYANNMRLYEATGCGAALLTEAAPNLSELFECSGPRPEVVTYNSAQEAIDMIQILLEADNFRHMVAEGGQHRTFAAHTYHRRMATVSHILKEMIA